MYRSRRYYNCSRRGMALNIYLPTIIQRRSSLIENANDVVIRTYPLDYYYYHHCEKRRCS